MTTLRTSCRVGSRLPTGGALLAGLGVLLSIAMHAAVAQTAPTSTAPASSAPMTPASTPISAMPSARPASSASPLRVATPRAEDGVRWRELTAPQREALAPLEREWAGIDASRKQKWVTLAGRFQSLGPEERARITARMSDWARLTPAERGQARIRFEEARQLPAPDRNARWQAYQALPPDARLRLAARAASAAASSPADVARRDAVAARALRPARDSREGKLNVVPSAVPTEPPRQVAPTLVQAGPGATTTLITRRPAPPAHQQTGMPKIAATPEFVNRSTLLPRRGPQAAAVSPAPVTGPAGLKISPPLIVPVPSPPVRPAPVGSVASPSAVKPATVPPTASPATPPPQ